MDFFNVCRFCMEEVINSERIDINSDHRRNFKYLTCTTLIDSEFYSNFSCRECIHKLSSGVMIKDEFIDKQKYLQNASNRSIEQILNEREKLMDSKIDFCEESNNDQNLLIPDVKLEYVESEFIDIKEEHEVDRIHTKHNININSVEEQSKIKRRSSSRKPAHTEKTYSDSDEDLLEKQKDLKLQRKERTKVKDKKKKAQNNNQKAPCEICGKMVASMKSHIEMVHLKTKRFECDVCSKSFYYKLRLAVHLKRHFNLRNVPCPTCGKMYFSKTLVDYHIKFKHEGQKLYWPKTCEICGRVFKSNQLYQVHKRAKHTGERIYVCKVEGCTKSYFGPSELRHHEKLVHIDPIECSYCHKSYRNIKKHIEIQHKERKFICNFDINGVQCGKKYVTESLLKRHFNITHRGQRDFNCQECNSSYSKLSDLENHQNNVHLRKRIKCELCPTLVTKKEYYRRHIILHHKELDEETKNDLLEKIKKTPRQNLFNAQLTTDKV